MVDDRDDAEIIQVPNLLKKKVSQSGPGCVDAAMLERAEAMVAALQDDYLHWVEEDLVKLQTLTERAMAEPVAARGDTLKALFAVSHDIKGQGGSFGYDLMTAIGNQLCRFIESVTVFDDAEMEVITLHVEALRLVVAERLEGSGGAKGENLVGGLHAVTLKRQGKIGG